MIYRARPGDDVERTVAVLQEAGIAPVLLDDPEPDVLLVLATMGTVKIRIAVEEEEVEAALGALRRWEEESAPRVAVHAKAFERQLVRAFVVVAVLASVLFLLYALLER